MAYKKRFLLGLYMLVVCAILGLSGCATPGKTSDDSHQIAGVLAQWKTAYEAGDVQAIMRLYADNYAHKGKDKVGIEKEIAEYLKENAAFDVRVNIVDATVTLKGDRATALPIALSGIAGSDTAKLELTKENGCWRVSGTDL